MASWVATVASQPTAVWWAARQRALHPAACRLIRRAIADPQRPTSEVVRRAWLYLFEYWEHSATNHEQRSDELLAQISAAGWDARAVRQYGAAGRPYLRTGPATLARGPLPPSRTDEIRLADLLNLEVVYPRTIEYDLEIPDEWLPAVVAELRQNLETSQTLEAEIGGFGLSHIAPISPSDNPNHERLGPTDGLSGLLRAFSDSFQRLCRVDIEAGQREFSCWPLNEDVIFARLRIWAASVPQLVSNEAFDALFLDLSDRAFWDVGHQRDLLRTMLSRWTALNAQTKRSIEARLLNGRPRREGEDEADFDAGRALSALGRLTWLSRHGCDLGRHVEPELQRLRDSAPDWTPEQADGAAEPMEGEGGFVTTRTEYTDLLRESLANTLSRAQELTAAREHFLIENDPYRGLATGRPVRALAVLTVAARQDDYPDWAWSTFLTADGRTSDRPRFMALIAERLTRCPSHALATFLRAASRWLRDAGEVLGREYPDSFRAAVASLVAVVEGHPVSAGTDLVGRAPRGWSTEALNSPTGMLVEALFFDPEIRELGARDGLPRVLLRYMDRLLALDGNLSRYAIVILASRLRWFYWVDPDWSEANLLSALGSSDSEAEAAFWSGFFWDGRPLGGPAVLAVEESSASAGRESRRGGKASWAEACGPYFGGMGCRG